jgi:hypothetical protein
MILGAGPLPDLADQLLGELHREDDFGFRNRQRRRLPLGGLNVTSRLARGNAKLSSQTRDDLGRRGCSVQELKGLIHAPGVLG